MTKEALKLALEALELIGMKNWSLREDKAITAIKEALANEALEKMAENARELGLDYEPEQDWIERERAVGYREGHQNALKQMAQPEQAPMNYYRADAKGNLERTDIHFAQTESVACDCDSPSWCKQYKKCNRKMLGFMPYVAQPQRTWVGLTDEELQPIADEYRILFGSWVTDFARAIEAKLRSKNS